jgi:hypothetical protein
MEPDRFESLLRLLSVSPSRRSAVRLLGAVVLGSPFALGGAGTDAHDAVKKCKKLEDKDKKKKCLKKAKKHNAAHCGPNCAGKSCGDDGCGGACGICTGGQTCQGGACACPSGQELCGSNCAPLCPLGFVRKPDCGCCNPGGNCATTADCCSGVCHPSLFICN